MKKHLPNFFTLMNLTSGSIGTILALKGQLLDSALFVKIGAFFDFLDGFTARSFNLYSPLGKQLDSLADLITFGFLPAVIMYTLVGLESPSATLPYIPLVITLCAALRLAKFNIDTTQQNVFSGLSTTAFGIFISALPSIIHHNFYPPITSILANPYFLLALSIGGSILLVSKIPFMAIKFNTYRWEHNKIRYIFLLVALCLVIFLQNEGIALSMVFYCAISVFKKKYFIQ